MLEKSIKPEKWNHALAGFQQNGEAIEQANVTFGAAPKTPIQSYKAIKEGQGVKL